MTGATVTYNGNPQPLGGVSVTNNIPIKITYQNGRVDRLYSGTIEKLSGPDYPTDIGKYEVTAELDVTIPNDTIIYTVTTVKATLEIKPIQGNITFGPDIFYYDGNPKPVKILSQSPVGEDLTITYNGSSTVPSAVNEYAVNVKFKNPNIFYNNTVKLTIKAIPTNICGTNITNETVNQQYQKNIIDFSPSVNQTGKVNFNYSVGRGASQFTIEYPLNSGNIVYPVYPSVPELRSKDIAVGTNIVDYVTGATVTVTGGGIPVNNTPISFDKNKTGTDDSNDKCLVTVYSPTNNNSWTYSISCVGAPATVIPTATGNFLNVLYDVPITTQNKYEGSNLRLLKPYIETQKDKISLAEYNAVIRIIDKYVSLNTNFTATRTAVLQDTNTNLKIIVNYFTDPTGRVVITLQYKRLKDSLYNTEPGPEVDDCHYYKYIGTPSSAFPADAITQLKSQIDTDSFKSYADVGGVKSGNRLKSILLQFVNKVIESDSYNNITFKFYGPTDPSGKGKVVIYNKDEGTSYDIDMPNGGPVLNVRNTDPDWDNRFTPEGKISIDVTNKTVEIIYPANCQL
jgi:hypothetical protein